MSTDRAPQRPTATSGTLPDSAWDPDEAAVVRARGIQSLSDRTPVIADLVTVSLRAAEPAYRANVPSGELKMATSVGQVLKAWRSQPEERAATAAWPREVGHRRAEQGVSLEALQRAYRIGGQVLFGTFMQWASEENLPRDRSIALAGEVWHVVDLHSTAAATAFRETRDQISGGGAQSGRMLGALLGGVADPDFVASEARACGVPERGRYVVMIRSPAPGGLPLDSQDMPEMVADIRVKWWMHGEFAIGVAAVGDATASTIATALPARPGRRTGISLVVDSLAELGHARRLAELAARTVTAGEGVACLEERLPAAMLTARPDLAGELSMRVLGPILALDQANRDLLLDTLSAWLAEGGSAPRAAATLLCHRNTVINRLRRIEILTGRSMSALRSYVEFSLAMEAFKLRADRQ